MNGRENESSLQLSGAFNNDEPLFTKAAAKEKPPVFINGLESGTSGAFSSGSSTKELRTEEAELAAVIAKVTGRASPFVNESDLGERKFTILCGEAACQENECPNEVAAALCVKKKKINEKRFVTVSGIEFNKHTCAPLSDNEKEAIVPHDSSVVERKQGPKAAKRTRPPKKDDNGNILDDEPSPILCNHICDVETKLSENIIAPVKSISNAHSKECLEYDSVPIKTFRNDKSEKMAPLENKFANGKCGDTISTTEETATKAKPASNISMIEEKVPKDDPAGNVSPVKETNVIETPASEEPQSGEKILTVTQSMEENFDKSNQEESLDTKVSDKPNNVKSETVKAYFPSVKPKVPSKVFVINSPEVQQNIINRRAAARNATSIAEFEPLITVSPEAEKLAMWKRPESAEKQPLASPELAKPSWIPPDSPDISPTEGTEGSPGSRAKDTSCCIPKDLRKQIHQKSSEKKSPKEEEAKSKSHERRDSEKGNNDNNNEKEKERKEKPTRKTWIIPLMLLVLIPASITVIVLLVKLKPWTSSDLDTESAGLVDTQNNHLEEVSPKALQQILQQLKKIKGLQGDLPDLNATSVTEDIFDSEYMVTKGGLDLFQDGAEASGQEIDDLHKDSDGKQNETFMMDKITVNQNFLSFLLNKSPQVHEAPPKIATGICSSFDDKEAVNTCSNLRPSVLKLVLKYVQFCQKGGDIIIPDYIKMYRYINSFLSSFGGFAAVQTKMLEERIRQLEDLVKGENASEYQKLYQMVYLEITSGTVGNTEPFSGTVLFTCLHRHLQFLTMVLEKTLTLRHDDSLQQAFKPAYEEILSKHHTWFVKLIYEVGFSSLITLEQAAGLLSIRQVESFTLEELIESLEIIVKNMKSLNLYTEDILIQSNALESIPKEVIT